MGISVKSSHLVLAPEVGHTSPMCTIVAASNRAPYHPHAFTRRSFFRSLKGALQDYLFATTVCVYSIFVQSISTGGHLG